METCRNNQAQIEADRGRMICAQINGTEERDARRANATALMRVAASGNSKTPDGHARRQYVTCHQ